MSSFGPLLSSTTTEQIEDQKGLLARYKALRKVSQNLNNRLVQRLPTDVLEEGARKIGLMENGSIVFDSMDQSSVLMDYCIYDVQRNGCNAIEQYLKTISPDSDSDELICLQAMQRAIYSIFVVETVIKDLGVTVRDIRTHEVCLIVDVGFSTSAQINWILASRLIPYDGFWMTGGAGLPMGAVPDNGLERLISYFAPMLKPNNRGTFDPASLIKSCIKAESSSQIRYCDPAENESSYSSSTSSHRRPKIGRNEPCPCGSGRKYKFCHLNRSW